MAKRSRWREILRMDAGPLGSFLAVMTASLVSVLLNSMLDDFLGRLVPPGIDVLLLSPIGIAVGMLVYFVVAKVQIKKK